MTRGILIAGNESSLLSAVAAEAAKRVESFASAVIPNRFPRPEGAVNPEAESAPGVIPLSWNPASSISARTLVLAAENRLEKITDAVLVCVPPAVYKSPEALSPEEIEILVNDHIRGWFFLARELFLYFRRMGAGSLSFAAPENAPVREGPAAGKDAPGRAAAGDLLGPSAAASFRAFVQGILASQANESFQIMGFTGAEAGAEGEFAAWLFKSIDEGARKNQGRWQKYSRLAFFR